LVAESLAAYFLCYKVKIGLSGLWYGWILGSVANTLFSWMMLLRLQRNKDRNRQGKKEALINLETKEYEEDSY